jgi:hypothetical protein
MMKKFEYRKIFLEILPELREREREIISRRFGLNGRERETLESIGKDFGVCRERIRQIQNVALKKLRPKLENYQEVFQFFLEYFKKFGNLRKEETLFNELGNREERNEIYLLLSLNSSFSRFSENENFHSFWLTNLNSFEMAKKVIENVFSQLKKIGTLKN